MATEEIITDKTIGPTLQNYVNARGWIDARAIEIRRELKQVERMYSTHTENYIGLTILLCQTYTCQLFLRQTREFSS